MATPVSIAIRRTDALDRVHRAAAQIAEATGATIHDFPTPHKQEALRPAIETEWLAETMEAIADALTAPEASPEPAKRTETHAAPAKDAKPAKGKDA